MVVEVVQLEKERGRSMMERLVFHGIVFNMSWEDPDMDRQALLLEPTDTVISITSAGCNPLNFLCQSPRQLISIDSNPAQNALLELKLAGIAALDHRTFFDIFSAQNPTVIDDVYVPKLRPLLSDVSQRFWDENIRCVARNIYRFGRMGYFCRILRAWLSMIGITQDRLDELFECRTLQAQREWYEEYAAPKLWGPVAKGIVNFRPFMYMAGVHPEQFNLVDGRHDIYEYVKERLEYALTQVPIYDNYFLSVAATAKMRGNRVPPYLLESNFETLRRNLPRVRIVHGWLGPYLDSLPAGSIDKFNLLDIFDWMTPEAFESTMKSVVRAASPHARLIYRSGSYKHDPPASVLPRLEPHAELARRLLAADRSATYGSFYVFSMKNGKVDAVHHG